MHAPYVINVASPNNRIRIPAASCSSSSSTAAASIGAKGLIVHGGHVTAGADPEEGYDSWRKAIERIDRPLPMLIENTAGGDGAMARGLDGIARLWDAVGDAADGGGEVGFCLDTCHAFASGEDLATDRGAGSRRSPAGSTWCTATTRATSSAPAGTGTPAWSPARSTRRCSSRWSGPPARPPSARRRTRPPTSAGCAPSSASQPRPAGRQALARVGR